MWRPTKCKRCGKSWMQQRWGGICKCGKFVQEPMSIPIPTGQCPPIVKPEEPPPNNCPHCGEYEPPDYQCFYCHKEWLAQL